MEYEIGYAIGFIGIFLLIGGIGSIIFAIISILKDLFK
mgnify:CR=1 FL=1